MIETERLILRKWKIEDAPSMYEYAKDPDVGPRAGWLPHKNVEESKMIISSFIESHPYCFALCLKDNINYTIGSVELMIDDKKTDEAELGYCLGKSYWGNGYMPEASKALLEYGFNELKLNTIWCCYYEGNNNSKRVQEKLGFVYHHTVYNYYCKLLNEYRTSIVSLITKDNWIKQNVVINTYLPKISDLWFRKELLSDTLTMEYNNKYGGTIDFSEDSWSDWYNYWIVNNDNKRYYRYLLDKDNNYIGEIAYHYDERIDKYMCDVIIHAKYRNNGYGSKAISLLCEKAKENGINALYDSIDIDNKSVSLFLKLGFYEVYRTNEFIMVRIDL